MNVLVIGYGNPGRGDDGLGPALAAALEAADLPGVTVEADYQLTVEHADAAARHDAVVFADASTSAAEPFECRRQEASTAAPGFSSHSVAPGQVLALAAELFGARPAAYVLAMRGYVFNEFGEGLSPGAAANLAAATDWLISALRAGRLAESPAVTGAAAG